LAPFRRHDPERSALGQRAAEESLPLRDAFAVLFFVSVGMVFDPLTVCTNRCRFGDARRRAGRQRGQRVPIVRLFNIRSAR
jgi:hypothetical protein